MTHIPTFDSLCCGAAEPGKRCRSDRHRFDTRTVPGGPGTHCL